MRTWLLLQATLLVFTIVLLVVLSVMSSGCATVPAISLPRFVDVTTTLPTAKALPLDVANDCTLLAAELTAHVQLRTAERFAARELEQACHQRVTELAADVVAADQWSKTRAVIVFVAGVVIGGITAGAIIQPLGEIKESNGAVRGNP